MGIWKRLTAWIMAAALLALLSACGSKSPDAADAPGSRSAAAAQAAMQAEDSAAPNGEANADGQTPSAPGTAAAPEASERPGGGKDLATPVPAQAADNRSSSPADVSKAEQSTPAQDAPTDQRQVDAARTGAGPAANASSPPNASQAPASSGSASPGSRDDEPQTVTLSVTGNAEWGTVVPVTEVAWNKGDTVRDVLIRTLKSHKLAYETRGAGALFYVVGIDGLFEFDDGPMSGWKYRVNGEVIGVSAGIYELAPGDRVEWFYTTDGNEDEPAAP